MAKIYLFNIVIIFESLVEYINVKISDIKWKNIIDKNYN